MLERPISKAAWTRVAFGDVVRKVNDKVDPWDSGLERYVAGEHMDTDDLRIRRWGLIGDDYLGPAFHMRFKPGHVLYGSRRTYLRKVALADFEGITANTTFVLETKDPARLMPELLPFLMQRHEFHAHSMKKSKGSVNPYINFSDLTEFEFLLPPPQEQSRICQLMIAAEKVKAQLHEVVIAGEAAERSAFEAILSELNGNLAARRLLIGDLFENVIDRGHDGLPILSVTIDGRVVRRDELERQVIDKTGDEKYLRVQSGDLAYNTMRLWQGSIGVVLEEGLISPAYTAMRAKLPNLNLSFYHRMLRSTSARRSYRAMVTGVASDRWRLYFKELANLEAPLVLNGGHDEHWSKLEILAASVASAFRRASDFSVAYNRLLEEALA